MMISKKALPRRTVLRGVGATLALPLLDGMVPALTAMSRTAAAPVRRLGVVYVPNGIVMEQWTPPGEGAGFEVTPILKPLADNIGMNEIQFCIMMITALGVGFITPPLGLNLFVVSGITGESILKIAARAVPYVLCMFVVVLLIAYIPAISTTLLPDIYR